MDILTVYPSSINPRLLDQAVAALRRGEVVAYPTDGLYALGCDALDQRAVERLCHAKGLNPARNLLSVVCADISQAAEYARIDNRAFRLMRQHLPGPFTFILPAASSLPKAFRARRTVGVRIPANPVATALAAALGRPLMTASVDIDGLDPSEAVSPADLSTRLQGVATLMIDGGEGSTVPSTVVDITDSSAPEVVRQGAGRFQE